MKKRNIIRPNTLKGKDKLNRIRELMRGTSINENVNRYVVELTKMGPDGKVYGIVRENKEYYIKVTDKTKNILAEDFQYMGGLMNKKSKSFPSYAKAIKNLNLKFMSLKESIGESGQVNIFKNDNLLKEHHPLKSDMKLSDTKGIGDGQEYVVNKKGSKLSYDNKEGKEKDGFGDNVAKKDSMDELEDVKLNETERLIDSILSEIMDDEPEELPKEIKAKFDAEDEAEYQERLADEYLSSMETPEDPNPDHVQFEYGIEESIKNLVNKVNNRIKKKSKVNVTSVLKEMRFDEKSTGLFEDEEEGYNLDEEKYVVKVDAPEKEEDIFGGDDSLDSLGGIDDMGDDEPMGGEKPFDDEPFDAGVEADEDEDPEKFIQQLAGKIGTSLRAYTNERGEPDLDLEKYVINSVISATHTSEMDEKDQKDIIKKVKMAGAGSDVDDKDVEADEDEKPEEEEMDIDVEMDDSEDESKDELNEVESGLNEDEMLEKLIDGLLSLEDTLYDYGAGYHVVNKIENIIAEIGEENGLSEDEAEDLSLTFNIEEKSNTEYNEYDEGTITGVISFNGKEIVRYSSLDDGFAFKMGDINTDTLKLIVQELLKKLSSGDDTDTTMNEIEKELHESANVFKHLSLKKKEK